MQDFLLRHDQGSRSAICGICGCNAKSSPGPQLYRAEDNVPVCRQCGRNAAPKLGAIVDLADVALRVGRITCQQGVWVPLAMLVEMTRVCQYYHDLLANESRNKTD